MTDIATLGLSIDTAPADKASDSLDRFSSSANTAAQKAEAFRTASQKQIEILAAMQRQLTALAGNLGFVGTLMAGMGPWGLAAAAGVGALVAAFNLLSQRANALGTAAQQVDKFTRTTGLAADQLQAIQNVAQKFGVSSEEVTTRLDRFTQQFQDLNNASGPLFETIRKVDKATSDQMITTRDAATMLELYGKAREKATLADKAAMDTTAFGRGGVSFGPVATAIAGAGGVAQVAKDMDRLGVLTNDEVSNLSELKTATEDLEKKARTAMDQFFSQEVLMRQAQFALKQAQILKDAQDAPPMFGFGGSLNEFALLMTDVEKKAAKMAEDFDRARTLLSILTQLGKTADFSNIYQPANRGMAAQPAGRGPDNDNGQSSAAQLNIQSALVGALGATATQAQILQQQLLALRKAHADNIITTSELTKAEGELKASFASQNMSATVAVLGQMASVAQQVAAKLQEIAVQSAKGMISVTPAQVAAIAEVTRQTALGTFAIQSQTDAIQIQTATFGMSAGAAAAYTAEQTRLAQALQNKQPFDEKQRAEFKAYADALGEATQKQAELTAKRRADFDLATAGMSDLERQIAAVQQQLHGDAWAKFMDDGVSQTLRLAGALKSIKEADKKQKSPLRLVVSNSRKKDERNICSAAA